MRARKHLKSTGIVISDDLTQENLTLLKRTKEHNKVNNCWTIDGRIIALITSFNGQETKINIKNERDLENL